MIRINFRYLNNQKKGNISKANDRVIALSLWKDDKNYIYDALRNIQLANLFFPAWGVRIYIPINAPNNHTLTLPANILDKMNILGAEVQYIDLSNIKLPAHLISSLVVDDPNISYFMIRDIRDRLSESDTHQFTHFQSSNRSTNFAKCSDSRNWGGKREFLLARWPGFDMKTFIRVSYRIE